MSDGTSCLLCRVRAAKLKPEASAFVALVAAHKTSLSTVFATMCEDHSVEAITIKVMVDTDLKQTH